MTSPIISEEKVRLPAGLSVRARTAVLVARPLSALPPGAICRVLTGVVRGARPATAADVLAWRTAVNSVSRRCAGHGCLQRSIAVVLLARSFGVAPVWRTGFRPDPFTAHAWVEAEGGPVGEPDAVAHFRPVLEVVPR